MNRILRLTLLALLVAGCGAKSDFRISRLTVHPVPRHSASTGPECSLLFGLAGGRELERLDGSVPYFLRGRYGSAAIFDGETRRIDETLYFRG